MTDKNNFQPLQPRINIVTLNWNGFEDTSELLESLFRITYPNFRIIVIDNNSENDEAMKLENIYLGKARIIKNKKNLGFAGGNNVGIKYSLEEEADYILLINNDTVVNPDFLEILVSKMLTDERIGIVAPRINYYDEPQKIWSDGGRISSLRGSGFANSDKIETEVDCLDREVSFVSGCCMLIKCEVFLKIGLFDENYFLYLEDADLCLRAIRAGFKIYIVPTSKIFHKVNSSTKVNNSSLPLYYTTRNRLYFKRKNFINSFYITVSYLVISILIKSIVWFVIGKSNNITSVYNGFKDFFDGNMGKKNSKTTEHV